jgi:hypothetical protein
VRGIDGAVMDLWIFPYVKGDQTSVRVRARLTAQVFATSSGSARHRSSRRNGRP